jgi:hypothetical protein
MANEAVLRNRHSNPVDFTTADVAIPKGTIMTFSSSREVKASSAGDSFAGIAAREKVAGDGRTQIACFVDGIFDMRAGGGTAITEGELVTLSGANIVEGLYADATAKAGGLVGKALEGAALGTAETIQVLVGVG